MGKIISNIVKTERLDPSGCMGEAKQEKPEWCFPLIHIVRTKWPQ